MAFEPKMGRIPIRDLSPRQPEGHWPPKGYVGEVVPFSATVFKEGHDLLRVDLYLTDPAGVETRHPMVNTSTGLDTWATEAMVDSQGFWSYRIRAYHDDWATWHHDATLKIAAGVDVPLMLTMGTILLTRALSAVGGPTGSTPAAKALAAAAKAISSKRLSPDERLAAAADPRVAAAMAEHPLVSLETFSAPHPIRVERARAGVGSWYEFFPRSEGAKQNADGSWTSGTFRTAARRLPAIASMGFDVVYIPPIHPIGTTNRKGPNNTLVAGPFDPGSPYGIGSAEGGHDSIHPELGTEKDLAYFVKSCAQHGLELAIDIALQASPDHPWVTEHPQFFTTLPDGSIAFAENPPKKYQDIYPLNFDNDPEGIYQEMLRVFRVWLAFGITIFRVDNPHTKPLAFWERLIAEILDENPDVIFLSEAFTKPAMMRSLAQVGFQQSYTYFTWRNTKKELEEYLTELSHETSDYLRPNLFVNTHDILPPYLQFGGVPAYKIRAAIAATAAPTWGVYSGYELIENVARPGAEENIDNEKYEFKPRDFAKAEALGRSLAPYLTMLNTIRAEHPALRQLRNLEVHWSDDDSILVYSKYLDGRFTRSGKRDAIIVVANVDPHSVRASSVYLDPTKFGVDPSQPFEVTDLITRQHYTWGLANFVRLDAFTEPVHILRVDYPKGI
ncbi:MAG: hypothetical protein RI885_2694 [Actinomycetota bacterium]